MESSPTPRSRGGTKKWPPLRNPLWGPRRPGRRLHCTDREKRAGRRASGLPRKTGRPCPPSPHPQGCPLSVMTQEHFSFSGPTSRGSSSGRKAEGGEGCLYFQAMASALPQAFSVDSQSLLHPSLLIGPSVCLSPTHTARCLSGRASTRRPEFSSPGQAPFLLQSLIHLVGKARAGPHRALPAASLLLRCYFCRW